jgi:hypothetical protein
MTTYETLYENLGLAIDNGTDEEIETAAKALNNYKKENMENMEKLEITNKK